MCGYVCQSTWQVERMREKVSRSEEGKLVGCLHRVFKASHHVHYIPLQRILIQLTNWISHFSLGKCPKENTWKTRVVSNNFALSPGNLGKIPSLTNSFQMAWFNHHLGPWITRESILRSQAGELGEVLDKESFGKPKGLDIRDRGRRWWEMLDSFEDDPWLWCFAKDMKTTYGRSIRVCTCGLYLTILVTWSLS